MLTWDIFLKQSIFNDFENVIISITRIIDIIVQRLFAFGRWRSVAIIVYHYTRLWHARFCWNNANNAKTKKKNRVPPDKMVYHYTLLCAIILDYFTIIPIISIIAIMSFSNLK